MMARLGNRMRPRPGCDPLPSLTLLFRLTLAGRHTVERVLSDRARSADWAGRTALLTCSAMACLLAAASLMNVADAARTHAGGVVCLIGFIAIGFRAIIPAARGERGPASDPPGPRKIVDTASAPCADARGLLLAVEISCRLFLSLPPDEIAPITATPRVIPTWRLVEATTVATPACEGGMADTTQRVGDRPVDQPQAKPESAVGGEQVAAGRCGE
jgi:hypothetical protein